MSTYTRNETELSFTYTSGVGVFNIAGQGTILKFVRWDHNGLASGSVVSVLDTISGTATSGLWLPASGVVQLANNCPIFTSGMDGVGANSKPITQDFYSLGLNSGLAIVISGGVAGPIRAYVAYLT